MKPIRDRLGWGSAIWWFWGAALWIPARIRGRTKSIMGEVPWTTCIRIRCRRGMEELRRGNWFKVTYERDRRARR
jgi:hypothetical protein